MGTNFHPKLIIFSGILFFDRMSPCAPGRDETLELRGDTLFGHDQTTLFDLPINWSFKKDLMGGGDIRSYSALCCADIVDANHHVCGS